MKRKRMNNLNTAADLIADTLESLPENTPDFDELINALNVALANLQHVLNVMEWNGE